jgi:moderate conductance mechanosensitive channel
MRLILRRFLYALVLIPVVLSAAAAQTSGIAGRLDAEVDASGKAAKAPANTADLQRLVDTLDDDSRRKAFVNDLKALIAVQKRTEANGEPPVGARLLEVLSQNIDRIGTELGHMAEFILDLPRFFSRLQSELAKEESRAAWLEIIAKVAAILVAGLFTYLAVQRLLRRPYQLIEAQPAHQVAMRAAFVLLRTLLELVPVALFVAVAYGVMTLVSPVHDSRVLSLALINAIAASHVLLSVSKMFFAPQVSRMRLFRMNDETANYGFLWCRRLIYFAIYGYFGIEAISALGVSRGIHDLMMRCLGLVICLLLIMLVLQNRQTVAIEIRGEAGPLLGQFRRRLADVWHLLAITYLVTIYGVWSLDVPGGFEFVVRATIVSLIVVIVVQGLVIVLGRLISRGFSLTDEQRQRFPGLEARANRYLPVLLVVMQTILYVVGSLAFLQTWGLDVVDWFSTPLGAALIARLTTIGMIVVMAMVFWELISAMIERYLTARDDQGNVIHRGQRVQTLLPLLRNIVLIVIAVMVTLTVLAELGVDTGPLIAGAGILGLAVGFGAQTFVKDVITGFFILVEDAVAVGDLVEVGGHRGKVEAMSIRSIQLRDIRGDVHRVPFSEVTSTVNRSKVFSFAFFDVGVAYREDVDHCMNVIREVGDGLRSDPVFAPDILENIEIMGVESFDDSAVVIRARIKTRAGKQRGIQRGFNRLLKNRFDAEGIEIPFPHRTIYFGVDSRGDAPAAHLRIRRDGVSRVPEGRTAPTRLVQRPEGEMSDFDEEVSDEPEVEPEPKG